MNRRCFSTSSVCGVLSDKLVRKRCSESREVRGEGLVEATPLLLMRLTRRTILKLSRHSCMSARVDRGKCLTMCIAQPEKRTLSLCPCVLYVLFLWRSGSIAHGMFACLLQYCAHSPSSSRKKKRAARRKRASPVVKPAWGAGAGAHDQVSPASGKSGKGLSKSSRGNGRKSKAPASNDKLALPPTANAFDAGGVFIRRKGPTQAATALLTLPDEKQRDALFSRIDCNGNGGLSLAEIDKACVELWPHFNNKPALMRAYKSADRNGDGFITRREFKKLLQYIIYFTGLWDKFESIDTDGDRRLSLEEFIVGSAMVGHPLSPTEARTAFQAMDDNGGGVVSCCRACAANAL